MSIHELLGKVKREITLPQIVSGRCVHSLIEQASCQACVTACPHGAWLLDDEELGLDTQACDGCGICVAACPQSAIVHDYHFKIHDYKGRDIAVVACERAGVSGDGIIPCLHALALSELLTVYTKGARVLFLTHGNCTACDRGSGSQSFHRLLEDFRGLLLSHGLPALSVREYRPYEWQARRQLLELASRGKSLSRRGFMRGVAGEIVGQGFRAASGRAEPKQDDDLSGVLPEGSTEGIFPHVPQIDPLKCLGCDACVNVCPQGAIQLQEQPLRYTLDARRCNGCGLCVDVCEASAVGVTGWIHANGQTIELCQGGCDSCGVPFHYPKTQDAERRLCRICADSGRKKWNLFQVLDS